MKEKYFNQELMPELDRLILAVANCRKTTPYSCVKMFAEQCSHECRTEVRASSKRVCHILIVQQIWRTEIGITLQHWSLWEQNIAFDAVL